MTFYHVTPTRNLESIINNGLIPAIGENSQAANEVQSRIYFFTSLDALEDGLTNWLGSAFDEDEQLALLQVRIPDGAVDITDCAAYEATCFTPIPPDHIEVLCDNDLDLDINALRQKEKISPHPEECAPTCM